MPRGTSKIKLKILDEFNQVPEGTEYTAMGLAEIIGEDYPATKRECQTLYAEGILQRHLIHISYFYSLAPLKNKKEKKEDKNK